MAWRVMAPSTASLSPNGYEEHSRAKLFEPNDFDMHQRLIVWSHPTHANRCIYLRNDSEVIYVSLAEQWLAEGTRSLSRRIVDGACGTGLPPVFV